MNLETVNLENSVGPSFELMQDGSMFVPYGEFAHRKGMQRFDRSAAERMGEDLRGIFSQIRRVVRDGIARRAPIYIGHPDVPGRGAEFPDKRAYGWVTSVAAENDGMRLSIKWTSEGDRLVRDGHFAFYSPYWEADEVGAGRSRVLRPSKLISVGLTNNPNIPVPALANEAGDVDDEQINPDDMKKELAEMLGSPPGHRIRLANTYDAALATHESAVNRSNDAAITARHLLYKKGAGNGTVALADAASPALGTIDNVESGTGTNQSLLLLGRGPTKKMVAAGEIAVGVPVYQAAGGKVSAAGTLQVGYSLTAAALDGDLLEVNDHPAIDVSGS